MKTHYPAIFKAHYKDEPVRYGEDSLGDFWYEVESGVDKIVVVLPMRVKGGLRRIRLPLEKWEWNGNVTCPSLTPSIKTCSDPEQTEVEWHGYLTAGVFTECG